MLEIIVPARELWDERTQEFINVKEQPLALEHSLVSLSRWESKWCKPFLTRQEKTREEIIDYVRCMTLTENVDPIIYEYLSKGNVEQINSYIDAPMTATWFSEDDKKKSRGSGEQITSELIYYWMVALNIPFECQYWHLNRLITLIRVCEVKNQKPKKMSRRELMSRNASLNAARKQKLNTKG